MPKCPKCNEVIDHLLVWKKVWDSYGLTEDGFDSGYGCDDYVPGNEPLQFECPECYFNFDFRDKLEAMDWLKDENL